MTNQEAIEKIKRVKGLYAYESDYEAFDIAIKALDSPTQMSGTSDLINRHDAIKVVLFGATNAIAIDTETGERKALFQNENEELEKAAKRIEELPSVKPIVFQKSMSGKPDLISRQAAIDVLKHDAKVSGIEPFDPGYTPFDAIITLNSLPSASQFDWIPCSERMPECEQEVLICTEKKLVGKDAYIDSVITPAFYEDGNMPEVDSKWQWYDMDYDKWDEENDCGIIPERWWENRHFNPDEVYNNPVDQKVIAWMPLPKPYHPKEDA